jgi:pimeloyl-ACP methyl ester carboxylesterase
MVLLAIVASGGCTGIKPGPVSAIKPVAEPQHPRVGNAYLFRGFIGVFSTGMNTLNDDLVAQGVRSHVYQSDQWSQVADKIAAGYKSVPNPEPIVLVGHSYGADNILRIAQRLKDAKVKVDLVITLDPVTPPKVPHNVTKAVNLYQSNGAMDNLPWLRGIPLEAERPGSVMLVNLDMRKDRTDLIDASGVNHFNIEKKPLVHAEVIKQIKAICVTRGAYAARNAPARVSPTPALAKTPPSPTTLPTQARLD